MAKKKPPGFKPTFKPKYPSTARYSPEHTKLRKRLAPAYDQTPCPRCGQIMRDDVKPGHPQKLNLSHRVDKRDGGLDVEDNYLFLCFKCNVQDAKDRAQLGPNARTAAAAELTTPVAIPGFDGYASKAAWLASFDLPGVNEPIPW